MLPAEGDEEPPAAATAGHGQEAAPPREAATLPAPSAGRETSSLVWFDTLTAGSRLGSLRTSRGGGGGQSKDVRLKVEWEVVEWTEDDGDPEKPAKRKKPDPETADNGAEAMEDVR